LSQLLTFLSGGSKNVYASSLSQSSFAIVGIFLQSVTPLFKKCFEIILSANLKALVL
jgi:hypothetical protein